MAWLAGDDEVALAEARAGIAASPEHADPWQLGSLRRWVRLAGSTIEATDGGVPLTLFDFEISGQWQRAAEAWIGAAAPTMRPWPYSAATCPR